MSRWQDAVITLWIVGLLVAGIAAIWGESIRALWLEETGAAGAAEPPGAAPRGTTL